MAEINTSSDLIDLLEREEDFRRDVARWLLARQGIQDGDAPIADGAIDGSLAALMVEERDRGAAREVRVDRIEALIAHVIEMQASFEARMDEHAARMNEYAARMPKADEDAKAVRDEFAIYRGMSMERELARRFGMAMSDGFGAINAFAVGGALVADWADNHRVLAYEHELTTAPLYNLISVDEQQDLRLADVVGFGAIRPSFDLTWFVGEASRTIGASDVTRARRRADILAKIKRGFAVLPFVYGGGVIDGVGQAAYDAVVKIVFWRESRERD